MFKIVVVISLLCLILSAILYTIDTININNKNKINKKVLSNELDVNEIGNIHIEFEERPKYFIALFKNEEHITFSNSKSYSELEYELCNEHKNFCLKIKWNVSNTRKIFWEVIFD